MKIALIVEGETEKAFVPTLRAFLEPYLVGKMPRFDPFTYHGRIPKGEKLKRDVERLLNNRRGAADYVIALTDVYTGQNPPDFVNAADAKAKMKAWVGANPRFFPHASQYDFEAWLLPYWAQIQRLAGSNKTVPAGAPEDVNHSRPQAHRIKEAFRTGRHGKAYVKPRDAKRILRGQNLLVSIQACAELQSSIEHGSSFVWCCAD